MHTGIRNLLAGFCLLPLLAAGESKPENAVYDWQIKHLMQPDGRQLQLEQQRQQVFIYEGLKLSDVELALDDHFNRIQHMMFIGTRLPPSAGGGAERTEQDGCE
ncbi:MAG: hypothetical protein PVG66_06900 [Chromatiales bacterium]